MGHSEQHASAAGCESGRNARAWAAPALPSQTWHPRWGRSCSRRASSAPGWSPCSASDSVVGEAGRHVVWAAGDRRRSARRRTAGGRPRSAEPVVLVPGFLAGDLRCGSMAQALRRRGHRTYRSLIHANVGCTVAAAAQLEARLEAVALRRGSRVQVVGHSLGGMLARGLAVRRPDLVAGIVTMGSPMLAPAAHHACAHAQRRRPGPAQPGRRARADGGGLRRRATARGRASRRAVSRCRTGSSFTAIYSRRDGIVDWRACVDPAAVAVEVTASHVGHGGGPARRRAGGGGAGAPPSARSVLEVDRGESA